MSRYELCIHVYVSVCESMLCLGACIVCVFISMNEWICLYAFLCVCICIMASSFYVSEFIVSVSVYMAICIHCVCEV